MSFPPRAGSPSVAAHLRRSYIKLLGPWSSNLSAAFGELIAKEESCVHGLKEQRVVIDEIHRFVQYVVEQDAEMEPSNTAVVAAIRLRDYTHELMTGNTDISIVRLGQLAALILMHILQSFRLIFDVLRRVGSGGPIEDFAEARMLVRVWPDVSVRFSVLLDVSLLRFSFQNLLVVQAQRAQSLDLVSHLVSRGRELYLAAKSSIDKLHLSPLPSYGGEDRLDVLLEPLKPWLVESEGAFLEIRVEGQGYRLFISDPSFDVDRVAGAYLIALTENEDQFALVPKEPFTLVGTATASNFASELEARVTDPYYHVIATPSTPDDPPVPARADTPLVQSPQPLQELSAASARLFTEIFGNGSPLSNSGGTALSRDPSPAEPLGSPLDPPFRNQSTEERGRTLSRTLPSFLRRTEADDLASMTRLAHLALPAILPPVQSVYYYNASAVPQVLPSLPVGMGLASGSGLPPSLAGAVLTSPIRTSKSPEYVSRSPSYSPYPRLSPRGGRMLYARAASPSKVGSQSNSEFDELDSES